MPSFLSSIRDARDSIVRKTQGIDSSRWAVLNQNGDKFVPYDSIESLTLSSRSTIPTEAQENGTLFAYDKVQQPTEETVTLLFSGNNEQVDIAIGSLDVFRQSTDVFTIVTPNFVEENMALLSYSITHKANNGNNLTLIDCVFKEVRSVSFQSESVEIRNRQSVDDKSKSKVNSGVKRAVSKNAVNKTSFQYDAKATNAYVKQVKASLGSDDGLTADGWDTNVD